MLNYIWFGLMAIALVVAAFNGTADGVTKGAVDSATTAVEIEVQIVWEVVENHLPALRSALAA